MSLFLENIHFSYGKKKALHNFTADLECGVYGLLGANGAGKTTLISIIVRLLTPQQGHVLWNGQNIRELGTRYFKYIGYLPQSPRFYNNFTIREFLLYMAKLKGLRKKKAEERSADLLSFVNLEHDQNKKIGACSGGMRQRVGIAQAMLNDPKVLILDEPTAGLDPLERIRFRNLISRLSEERIVLLATHIVSDVEYIAQQILLLKEGELLQQGSPSSLIEPVKNYVWELTVDNERTVGQLMQRYRVSNIRQQGQSYVMRIVDKDKPAEDAYPMTPTLEDVYLWHFGGTENEVGMV